MKTKQCTKCKQVKPRTSEHFYRKSSVKDGLQAWCKKCKKAHDSVRSKRPGVQKRSNSLRAHRRNENKKYVWEFLARSSCIDCGESNPLVLEFDHVRGVKYESIARLIAGGYSLDLIKDEIEKCEVRCANCHAIKTQYERKSYKIDFYQSLGII